MKKFLKWMQKVSKKTWVRLVFALACIVVIFVLAVLFGSYDSVGAQILDLITGPDTLSIFFVAVFSLIVLSLVTKSNQFLEESNKTDDDHHKVICTYMGHSKEQPDGTDNAFTPDGTFMTLPVTPVDKGLKNPVKDVFSDGYSKRQKLIENYRKGTLFLPSLNVYANIAGNTTILIKDSKEKHALPDFVYSNALELLDTHHYSTVKNGVTVRLNDMKYDEGTRTLTLDTMRSQYFDMLLTNRCMDYKIQDEVSIRDVYEFGPTVSPINKSKLGNQIGINGLIYTEDGYLLVEKRGHRKTTWRNKFAQPISLALKGSEILVNEKGVIDFTPEAAERNLKRIVLKTIQKNFGITEADVHGFHIQTNFMGIARDLLEGGKPNMYFYVVVKYKAEEFQSFLETRARLACTPADKRGEVGNMSIPSYNKDKLSSDFYLVHQSDFNIRFHYDLELPVRKVYWISRRYAPFVSKRQARRDGANYRRLYRKNGTYKREVGEALLACLYYATVCRERIQRELDGFIAEDKKEPTPRTVVTAFGELLMRFDPPRGSIVSESSTFTSCYGGTEANVLACLNKFGHATEYLTALPKSGLGDGALKHLEKIGVGRSNLLVQGDTMGLYFVEDGSGSRGATVEYLRRFSEVARLNEKAFDFDKIFDGVKLFHITGISLALSESCRKLSFRLIHEAKKRQIPVSFDFNYRAKLWSADEARPHLQRGAMEADILLAGPLDFSVCLQTTEEEFLSRFENKTLFVRNRQVIDKNKHSVSVEAYQKRKGEVERCSFATMEYPVKEKIGGGDAFDGGILHGLLSDMPLKDTLLFGVSAFVLKHQMAGDTFTGTQEEVAKYAEQLKGENV